GGWGSWEARRCLLRCVRPSYFWSLGSADWFCSRSSGSWCCGASGIRRTYLHAEDSAIEIEKASAPRVRHDDRFGQTDAAVTGDLDPRDQMERHVALQRPVVSPHHAQDVAFALIGWEADADGVTGAGRLMGVERTLCDDPARDLIDPGGGNARPDRPHCGLHRFTTDLFAVRDSLRG